MTLAPGRGAALSSAATSAAPRSSTTRRTTARVSPTVTSTEEEEETSTTISTRSTPSTTSSSSSTARLAPVRSTPSTASTTSPTTSAGRSSPTSASSTSGISDSTSANESNGADTGSKSNGGTIAGVIIAVLAVLLIAAFFGWRYWKKKKNARLASGGLGEGDTFYPYGSGGASSGANGTDKNGNGAYNQRINSFEDLASNAAAAGNNGEKYGQNGGYGTMGGLNDDEKAYGAAAAGAGATAGFGAIDRQRSAEQENFAGRGLSPYNSFSSFSHLPNNGLQGLTSSPIAGQNDSYPPTPQQMAHYSQQGSIYGGAPNAALMGHPQDASGFNGFNNNDHLPQHQDRALSNAMDAYGSQNGLNNGNGNAAALAAAGLAAGAGAGMLAAGGDGQQQQGPFADPATEGKTYIVTRTFEPSMPDELVIFPGDRIQIVVPYDDGWCLGCNLTTSERDGIPPTKGVFPRDCVEEWTLELETMMNGTTPGEGINDNTQGGQLAPVMEGEEQRPTSVASDIPLNMNGTTDLQRAPTLPPLDMGDNSRFSMTSANNNNKRMSHISNNNRPASLIPGNVPLPASIKSPVSATSVPLPGGAEEEDIYGGVSDDLVSPVSKTFAPDIQVSSNEERIANGEMMGSVDAGGNKRDSVPQFGSSYHIADYASRIGDEDASAAATTAASPAAMNNRLSTLDEESSLSNANEEFPSTPRTMSAATASPRFSGVPPLSATGGGSAFTPRSPAASSNGRLSVVDVNHNRLSVGSNLMMPSSQSVKSLKRTSSLIASEDAKTFLA